MCAVCRARRPKKEMLRFIQLNDVLELNESGRSGGRGINICPSAACVEVFFNSQAYRKIWPNLQMSSSSIENVREKVKSIIENREFRKGGKKVVLRVSKDIAEAQIGSAITRIS